MFKFIKNIFNTINNSDTLSTKEIDLQLSEYLNEEKPSNLNDEEIVSPKEEVVDIPYLEGSPFIFHIFRAKFNHDDSKVEINKDCFFYITSLTTINLCKYFGMVNVPVSQLAHSTIYSLTIDNWGERWLKLQDSTMWKTKPIEEMTKFSAMSTAMTLCDNNCNISDFVENIPIQTNGFIIIVTPYFKTFKGQEAFLREQLNAVNEQIDFLKKKTKNLKYNDLMSVLDEQTFLLDENEEQLTLVSANKQIDELLKRKGCILDYLKYLTVMIKQREKNEKLRKSIK